MEVELNIMSYEYLVKTPDQHAFLEIFHQYLIGRKDIIIKDLNDDGFSVFFMNDWESESVKKWGGNFYFTSASGDLMLVVNSDHKNVMTMFDIFTAMGLCAVELEEA